MRVASGSVFGIMTLQDGDSSFCGVAVGDWANANARAGCMMCCYIHNDTILHSNTDNGVGDLGGITQSGHDEALSDVGYVQRLTSPTWVFCCDCFLDNLRGTYSHWAWKKSPILYSFNFPVCIKLY